jgi:glucosyl-3-phosphoglycerate synthase
VDPQGWLERRTFRGADQDPEALAAALAARGTSVAVCLPALEVEDTVGPIVAAVRERYMEEVPLVRRILVVDSESGDATARRAREAGAEVLQDGDLVPHMGRLRGKGEAMWKSLAAIDEDLVVWLDADVVDFDPHFVPGLLGPLVDEGIGYVKAVYERRLGEDPVGGGRVTEIMARPLLNQFHPELALLAQPLSGEAAGRRRLLAGVPFLTGYAVEIGLLIEIARRHGVDAIAQSDLGARRHASQSTSDLGLMGSAILQGVLHLLARDGRLPEDLADGRPYRRQVPAPGGGMRWDVSDVTPVERPPMDEVLAAR